MLVLPMRAKFVSPDSPEMLKAASTPGTDTFTYPWVQNFTATVLEPNAPGIMRWLIKGYDALMSNPVPADALEDAALPPSMLEFKVALLYMTPELMAWLSEALEEEPDEDMQQNRMNLEGLWADYQAIPDKAKPTKQKITRVRFMEAVRLMVDRGNSTGAYLEVPAVNGKVARYYAVGWRRRLAQQD
jgi:hypothetical protein